MQNLGILNIYKLNMYQVLLFMFKTLHGLTPTIFSDYFSGISHKYCTRTSDHNLHTPFFKLNVSKFSIRYRGPYLWNKVINRDLKNLTSVQKFKLASKKLLINKSDNIFQYF